MSGVAPGDVAATITATGTIEPEEVINVCAQVTGVIERLGADLRGQGKLIDHGSRVRKGTVLAQVDSALYSIRVEQQQASCHRAEADVALAQAKLELIESQWKRAQEHRKTKSVSDADFDLARFNFKEAKLALVAAEAAVVQHKAALKEAQLNLDHTTIRSPVEGIVIDRRVNVGQIVVANPSATSLFLIARDLRKLQVWVSVNESDISRIREAQRAHFSVLGCPGQVFEGKVACVRLNATMTRNVVTYTVVVATDNREGRLLPYRTASVQFDGER